MIDKESFERILDRERKARKEAERIMEEKSLELLKVNESLLTLNANLEKNISERTQEIKKNADQLHILFNENPFPVMVYDKVALKILDVNKTAIVKYGYTKNEFLQKTIYDLHPTGEVEKLEKYCSKKSEKKSGSSSWKHLSAKRKQFDVRITANSIMYNDIPCRIAIIEDVTEKNRLLKEKDVQKKKYQDFIENSSDIIYIINSKGDFIYVNPSGIKASGYRKDELLKMNFTDLISPNYKKQVTSFYKFQMEQKLESTYTEFPVISKDGKEYWIGQNVEVSKVSDEDEIVYNGTARNITDRKKLEKALLRSEEKYRSIIENMELGLVEVDPEGFIIKAYPRFCNLTGYDANELEGRKGADFLLDEEGRKFHESQLHDRKMGNTNVYEIQLIRKDNTKIWVLISGAPFYDEYNRYKGSVGIHLDITERKKLENDLILSKTNAENLLKSKEIFIANVSHEIRTPLNAIIGITELMLQTVNDESLNAQLAHVSHAGKGLLSLINELLLVSKIDADKLTLNPSSYSLTKCLESNFELHKNKANAKGLLYSIELNLPENNHYCFDHLKLGQVIQNLLSNSLKFTNSGTVKLSATLYSSSYNSDIIDVQVADTGIGIPQEDLESIFNNFEQAGNNETGDYGGTGLGLSIVKKILALMGSEISVESKNGTTRFGFYLKLPKSELLESKVLNKSAQKLSLEGIQILVAEDNEANRFLIESALTNLKADFRIVNNGLEAIEFLSTNSVDIILMDMRMPIMDGIEASRKIREVNLHDDKPIIALTANADEKNKLICLANGMNDFLAKPYSIIDLVNRIKFSLGQQLVADQEQIDELPFENEDFQNKLIQIFIEESELRLIKLKEAHFNQEFETIIGICHSMRPSLMHLQQESLYVIAKNIETGDNLNSDAQSFINELEEYLDILKLSPSHSGKN